MNKYSRNYIGCNFETNQGYMATVVDGGIKPGCATIYFEKPVRYTLEVDISQLKRGNVRNHYHRSCCGVGYMGVGDYSCVSHKTYSSVWRDMLSRCYGNKNEELSPTYVGVSVCDEWLCFQKFCKWMDGNYIKGWCLDKDLLSKDSKIYSPETCVFVPKYVNNFLTNKQKNNKSGYPGVSLVKSNRYIAKINDGDGNYKHLSTHDTAKEASVEYFKYRAKIAIKIRYRYIKDALSMGVEKDIIRKVSKKIK